MPYHMHTHARSFGVTRPNAPRKESLFNRLIRRPLVDWQRRKATATLEQLDDWILADIGLFRGQIPDVVDDLIASDVRPASLRPGPGRRERQRRDFRD